MKYQPPYGSTDPDASFVDGNPALGIEGSPVPAKAFEHPQRELVDLITRAGLEPSETDLGQVYKAIQKVIQGMMPAQPKVYELGEFYFFRHPVLKAGFQPAQGGLLTGAAELYPEVWEYLKTADGQRLCLTESAWQALTRAVWATLADGTKVGWNGIGGAPFYAPNLDTGALRLPDLRGMYMEAAGFDALGVGGVHGDGERNKTGALVGNYADAASGFNGVFTRTDVGSPYISGAMLSNASHTLRLDISRQVPTANKNQPRAWGALACVYLGPAAS